jgi:uncharacterized HAD superfamily protein
LRIGVDIDGVISDSYPVWVSELNGYYRKNITVLEKYEMHLAYDVPPEDMNTFFENNMEQLLGTPQPVVGAKEGIEGILRLGHEVVYLTARRPEDEAVTRRWLRRHRIPHETVLFSNLGGKEKLVRQWSMELFIEDYQLNARKIAASGVPVLLLDTTYNQGALPREIVRCKDWPAILQAIGEITCKQEKATR